MKNNHVLLIFIFLLLLYACNSNDTKTTSQIACEDAISESDAKDSICEENDSVRHNTLCFVAESFGEVAYLYEKPNGKVIDTLYASTEKDYYVSVELNDVKSGYANIDASYIFRIPDTLIHTGWIKTSHLGIYVSKSAGNDNGTVYLYSSPSVGSEIIDSISNPVWGDTFRVCNCKDGWIQTIYNAKKCWISPDDQESNNVTPSCM